MKEPPEREEDSDDRPLRPRDNPLRPFLDPRDFKGYGR